MRYLVVILSVLVVLSGCKNKEKEVLWGVYQEPIQPQDYPRDSGVNELNQLWKKDIGNGATGGYALLSPGYSGDGIFAAGRQGTVYKVDAGSGKTLWTSGLGGSVYSGVGLGEGIVTVAMDDGSVSALSQTDGKLLWNKPIRRQISAIPVVDRSRVVVRTADGLILGLDAGSGKIVWQLERVTPGLSVHGDSMPTIAGDAVFVGLSNGTLIANNVINGREYWEAEIAFARGQNELERLIDSDTPPLIDGNTVYAAAYQGNIVSLQIVDAQTNWQTGVSTRLPMALHNDTLFATDDLGGIVAINAADGSILWEQKSFQGRGVSRPIAVSNRVVVGDADGRIHTLDINTGTLIESKKSVSGAILSIVGRDNQFTVFSSEGNLAGYSL